MNTELSWLPNSLLKGINIPTVTIEEDCGQPYGGYYKHGTNNLIIVANDEDYPRIIAHELCHHIQREAGRRKDGDPSSIWRHTSSLSEYKKRISEYFSIYWWEYEALLFETKYYPSETNTWWLKKLVLEKDFT